MDRRNVHVGLLSGPLPSKNAESDEAQRLDLVGGSEETADFPDFAHHIERTDSCGGQFQGEANAGRIAESLVEANTKLRRHCVIGVWAHGKGVGDAKSNVPTRHIRAEDHSASATRSGTSILPNDEDKRVLSTIH